MFKKNIFSAVLAGAVLLSGSYAHADFNYAEHHYATFNGTPEDVSGKDAYLNSIPELKNSVPANAYILELQKVAADANGLKIDTYKNNGDYKRVVQPVRIAVGENNSHNFGNYQILLGTKSIYEDAGYEYNSKQPRNPQADAGIIWLIGHEMGHGVLNHCTGANANKRIEEQERDADRIAWYTLEKTSDFGWGYAFNIDIAFRTDCNNEEYIKRQTNNKLWIHGWNKHDTQYELNVNGRYYNVKDFYDGLIESTKPGISSAYNSYTLALGQLGYIYSKEKTIDVRKIEVVDETKYTYKKSKLIYRSANMPNGYKTIAFFNAPADVVQAIWNRSKYTSGDGYGLENMGRDLVDLQQTQNNEWEKALIISIKYIGIDVLNGHNHFDI